MTNKDLVSFLSTYSMLLALHDENQFKVKMYDSASQLVKNSSIDFIEIPDSELELYDGIGKKIASDIIEFRNSGMTGEFDDLMSKTPAGLLEVLNLKGIGPRKVRTLWIELGIESLEQVIEACRKGIISKLKGFGAKTEEKILAIAEFTVNNRGKLLYAEAEQLANDILDQVKGIELVGEVKRGLDIISTIQFISSDKSVFNELNNLDFIEYSLIFSSPFTWRGKHLSTGMKIEVYLSTDPDRDRFFFNAGEKHLNYQSEGISIGEMASNISQFNENELYQNFKLFVPPVGAREGDWELSSDRNASEQLVTEEDITGIIHNHSTWSDGANSIEEMALACKERGYQYFGISDHSKSAFYANGLYEDRIEKQQKEIDELNKKYPDFKIFKGIEADILNDGQLDYNDDVLSTFDYVVSSIHSILDMDMAKSMQRLITAIENPYTTILGHLTGRLLLRREAYPLNHKKIIDACAANNVIIELNSNPWRLDMDWKYISYAMEKGVMMSLNPDAHNIKGIDDVKYGIVSARKGGLTKEFCLNTKSVEEIAAIFKKKIPALS